MNSAKKGTSRHKHVPYRLCLRSLTTSQPDARLGECLILVKIRLDELHDCMVLISRLHVFTDIELSICTCVCIRRLSTAYALFASLNWSRLRAARHGCTSRFTAVAVKRRSPNPPRNPPNLYADNTDAHDYNCYPSQTVRGSWPGVGRLNHARQRREKRSALCG